MSTLINFAGMSGVVAASILISWSIGRLILEAFFRAVAPPQPALIPRVPREFPRLLEVIHRG